MKLGHYLELLSGESDREGPRKSGGEGVELRRSDGLKSEEVGFARWQETIASA